MLKVICPNCQKEVAWSSDSPFRPFCSKRCQLIDLGAWADDSYTIHTNVSPETEDDNNEDKKDNPE